MRCRQIMTGVLLVMTVSARAAEPSAMAGAWYMEGVENNTHVQIFFDDKPDGSFDKRIRDVTNCSDIKDWRETGSWTFGGNRYDTITRNVAGQAVDAALPDYNDTFIVTVLDMDRNTMHDTKTLVTWSLEKVASTFEMPLTGGCTA